MSSSSGSACPDGYRDDDFMLYEPLPCSLNVTSHRVLLILQAIVFALAVLEATMAMALNTHSGKIRRRHRFQTASFLVGCGAITAFCVYTLARGDAVVAVSRSHVDSAVLWILVSLVNVGIVASGIEIVASFTQSAGSLLTETSSSLVRLHRTMRVLMYSVLAVNAVMSFVLAFVLVQVLPEPGQRDIAGRAFAIVLGSLVVVVCSAGLLYVHWLRVACAAQISFLKSLPSVDTSILTQVAQLRARLTLLGIGATVCFGSPLLMFLIGGKFRWRYELLHTALLGTCFPVVLLLLVYTQSPVLSFVWGRDHSYISRTLGLSLVAPTNTSASDAAGNGSSGPGFSADDVIKQLGAKPNDARI